MPRKYIEYLDGHNIYACSECTSHLSCLGVMISRNFVSRTGKAYLFSHVVNVKQGVPYEKRLRTGKHVIVDLYCRGCGDNKAIGWKYLKTDNESQSYKIDKCILERAYLRREKWID